ncbi:hypothetical protein GJ496_006490 [Pomphorhynchus laevis]|nr:hypothetical protein GJ496_006490 [Pomphorhynchus laevis]
MSILTSRHSEKRRRQAILKTVANRYDLISRLGSGSFGEVYKARDTETGNLVAVKTEIASGFHPQLTIEKKIYEELMGEVGFAKMYFYGIEKGYRIIVMDVLGPTLEELFMYCFRKFSEKTVLMIADQSIERLCSLHKHFIIHRDVKPDNMVIGLNQNASVIHFVDFGLCKEYRNPESLQHVQMKTGRSLTGTARYASMNAHSGREQSRRDDLESLGYVLLYLLRGKLPWQGIQAATKRHKYYKIHKMKQECDIESLCKGYSPVFAEYMNYVKNLDFTERPDYNYMKNMFRKAMLKKHYKYDYNYDWITSKKCRIRRFFHLKYF